MTERERLSELLEKAIRYADKNCGRPFEGQFCGLMADYLISNGVMIAANGVIAPPVMVGQTVWVIVGGLLKHIAECEVIAVCHHIVSLDEHRKIYTFSVVGRNSRTPDTFIETDIGKRVFFAKEHAENVLAIRRKV